MTESLLCDALIDHIKKVLSHNSTEDANGVCSQKEPHMYKAVLPPKRYKGRMEDFPLVCVTPANGTTENEESQSVDVQIHIGVRSEAIDGYEYLFVALDTIRESLLAKQGQTIKWEGMTFRMLFPFKWDLMQEEYPFWWLRISTKWQLSTTKQVDDFDENF